VYFIDRDKAESLKLAYACNKEKASARLNNGRGKKEREREGERDKCEELRARTRAFISFRYFLNELPQTNILPTRTVISSSSLSSMPRKLKLNSEKLR
jgi:hypothetical protein